MYLLLLKDMGIWSKDADWLPKSNAKAQYDFYKKDFEYSATYLKYVESFKDKKIANYEKILKIAQKDVEESKKNIDKSLKKLNETKQRDKN